MNLINLNKAHNALLESFSDLSDSDFKMEIYRDGYATTGGLKSAKVGSVACLIGHHTTLGGVFEPTKEDLSSKKKFDFDKYKERIYGEVKTDEMRFLFSPMWKGTTKKDGLNRMKYLIYHEGKIPSYLTENGLIYKMSHYDL